MTGAPVPRRTRRAPSRTRLVVAAGLATVVSVLVVAVVLAVLPAAPVTVTIPDRTLPADVAAAPCRALAARLPDTLGELGRRGTGSQDPRLAAWGAPAAELVCGVPVPPSARLRPAVTVDGVSWDYRDAGEVVEWTTVDRDTVQVALRVPTVYDDQEALLADLVAPLQATIGQVPLEENLPTS